VASCPDEPFRTGLLALADRTVELTHGSAEAYVTRGMHYAARGMFDKATADVRKAIELKPEYAEAYYYLGTTLGLQHKLPEAEAAFRKAIALKPEFADAYNNLGAALADQQNLPEAVAAYRKAIELDPHFAFAYNNLGNALVGQEKWPEAVVAFRKAIELKPDYAVAYNNLGGALNSQDKMHEAEAAYRKAIELNPSFAVAYYNLGKALADHKKLPDAIVAFQKAIDLQPDFAEAYWLLGWALQRQGKYAEAADKMKRGRELGSRRPDWPVAWSAEWVRGNEQCSRLDPKLPRFLSGEIVPADAAERVALAYMCKEDYRQFYAASTRFFSEAFADQPALADDVSNYHRRHAARAAALAGCGQGKDAADLEPKECARLRGQALAWLRADLTASQMAKDALSMQGKMRSLQQDTDFAGVRGDATLAKLPEAERQEWQKFWQEVELERRAAESK
jgi:tetratricopeptide (TPR) repeat protein